MLMTPILKSYCMVIPHILTKTFSPKKEQKPDFKLKNESLEADLFFTISFKNHSVCTEKSWPTIEKSKNSLYSPTFSSWDTHQKFRLELRIQVICVSAAFAGVHTLVFNQNRHALRTVLVRRHDGIAHKPLQKSKNEILLCNWATRSIFLSKKKNDLFVKNLS